MNRRELAFCTAYIHSRNPYEAARKAGYSESYVIRKAYGMLNRPHIQDYIQHMTKMVEEKVALDQALIINELGAMALTRPDEFMRFDAEGGPGMPSGRWVNKPPDELTPIQKAALKEIRTRDIYTGKGKNRQFVRQEFQYVLHDRMDALTLLGKHFGAFEEHTPSGRLGRGFENVPQKELEETMEHINRLRQRALELQRDEDVIDGEVLSND